MDIKEIMNTKLRPYDDSAWDNYSMYDNLPYYWDPDLNVEKVFKTITGNIIKAHRCILKEVYEVKHE